MMRSKSFSILIILFFLLNYHSADTVLREHFQNDGVRYSSVNNVCPRDASSSRVETAVDFRNHAAGNDSAVDTFLDGVLVQNRNNSVGPVALLLEPSADIRQHNELGRAECHCDFCRYGVCVDVIALTVGTYADWCYNRDVFVVCKHLNDSGVDFLNLPDKADIKAVAVPVFGHFLSLNQIAVDS